MKRLALMLCAGLAFFVCQAQAHASWSSLSYGGYQPWWNLFACKNKCLTPEEERLQRFWHDYYDALKNYYHHLDKIDWVAYYKNHGYQLPSSCCGPNGTTRVHYAPVFVSPNMNWAVPNTCLGGPPNACGGGGYPGCGPMGMGPGYPQ